MNFYLLVYVAMGLPIMVHAMHEDYVWISNNTLYYGRTLPLIFDWVKSAKDCKELKRVLDEGANPNADQKYAGTLLQQAIDYRNHGAAQLLLQAGADPNKVGWSTLKHEPLIMAVREFDYDLARMLLQHGAEVNGKIGIPLLEAVVGNDRLTPDDEFIEKNNHAMLKMLLLWGANSAIELVNFNPLCWYDSHNRKASAAYIQITQQRLIKIMTKILSRGIVAGVRLPIDMVCLIVSYCYPHA